MGDRLGEVICLYLDPTYMIMVLPAILLALWAQSKVKSTYAKYSRYATRSGLSGAQAASRILSSSGLDKVPIESIPGNLTDHYDPKTRSLRLSSAVYSGQSIAAVGIAAHEAGHAIQHSRRYVPLQFRNAFFPVAHIGSKTAFPLIVLGMVLGFAGLIQVGVLLFSLAVLFQVVTLPVEFNATRRAKAALTQAGLITTQDEAQGVNAVLSAAALTYVAATVTALAQLLYFFLRSRR